MKRILMFILTVCLAAFQVGAVSLSANSSKNISITGLPVDKGNVILLNDLTVSLPQAWELTKSQAGLRGNVIRLKKENGISTLNVPLVNGTAKNYFAAFVKEGQNSWTPVVDHNGVPISVVTGGAARGLSLHSRRIAEGVSVVRLSYFLKSTTEIKRFDVGGFNVTNYKSFEVSTTLKEALKTVNNYILFKESTSTAGKELFTFYYLENSLQNKVKIKTSEKEDSLQFQVVQSDDPQFYNIVNDLSHLASRVNGSTPFGTDTDANVDINILKMKIAIMLDRGVFHSSPLVNMEMEKNGISTSYTQAINAVFRSWDTLKDLNAGTERLEGMFVAIAKAQKDAVEEPIVIVDNGIINHLDSDSTVATKNYLYYDVINRLDLKAKTKFGHSGLKGIGVQFITDRKDIRLYSLRDSLGSIVYDTLLGKGLKHYSYTIDDTTVVVDSSSSSSVIDNAVYFELSDTTLLNNVLGDGYGFWIQGFDFYENIPIDRPEKNEDDDDHNLLYVPIRIPFVKKQSQESVRTYSVSREMIEREVKSFEDLGIWYNILFPQRFYKTASTYIGYSGDRQFKAFLDDGTKFKHTMQSTVVQVDSLRYLGLDAALVGKDDKVEIAASSGTEFLQYTTVPINNTPIDGYFFFLLKGKKIESNYEDIKVKAVVRNATGDPVGNIHEKSVTVLNLDILGPDELAFEEEYKLPQCEVYDLIHFNKIEDYWEACLKALVNLGNTEDIDYTIRLKARGPIEVVNKETGKLFLSITDNKEDFKQFKVSSFGEFANAMQVLNSLEFYYSPFVNLKKLEDTELPYLKLMFFTPGEPSYVNAKLPLIPAKEADNEKANITVDLNDDNALNVEDDVLEDTDTLTFWADEVRHALSYMDRYDKRSWPFADFETNLLRISQWEILDHTLMRFDALNDMNFFEDIDLLKSTDNTFDMGYFRYKYTPKGGPENSKEIDLFEGDINNFMKLMNDKRILYLKFDDVSKKLSMSNEDMVMRMFRSIGDEDLVAHENIIDFQWKKKSLDMWEGIKDSKNALKCFTICPTKRGKVSISLVGKKGNLSYVRDEIHFNFKEIYSNIAIYSPEELTPHEERGLCNDVVPTKEVISSDYPWEGGNYIGSSLFGTGKDGDKAAWTSYKIFQPMETFWNSFITSRGLSEKTTFNFKPKAELNSSDSTIVWVHGYNVRNSFEDKVGGVFQASKYVYKTKYAQGFRGNFIAFHWNGLWHKTHKASDWLLKEPAYNLINDQALFNLDIVMAFKSGYSLHHLLHTLLAKEGFQRTNIIAHSLGNNVVWEAMRINYEKNGTLPLCKTYTMSEAAVWPEALYSPLSVPQFNQTWVGLFHNAMKYENNFNIAKNFSNRTDIALHLMYDANLLAMKNAYIASRDSKLKYPLMRDSYPKWRIPETLGLFIQAVGIEGEMGGPNALGKNPILNTNGRIENYPATDLYFNKRWTIYDPFKHMFYGMEPVHRIETLEKSMAVQ